MPNKPLLLASLALTHPSEFADRVATILEVRWDRTRVRPYTYDAAPFAPSVGALGEQLAVPGTAILAESALAEVDARVNERIAQLSPVAPFHLHHNADFDLARFCYAAVRMLRPEAVVETGVGYGVTSAFILAALAANGAGQLHSVDLPPLAPDADRFVGFLVPDDLRSRWYLHRGATRRTLPAVLKTLSSVGMFVHDSLHTYRTMLWEFETVAPHLTRPGLVIADNIGANAAWHDWTAARPDMHAFVVREIVRNGRFGVAIRT